MKKIIMVGLSMLLTGSLFIACGTRNSGGDGNAQVVKITVTDDGFVPSIVKVSSGKPVKLIVTRKTDQTCAKEIVIADYNINQKLPLNQPVEILFTPTKTGEITYACGMDMIHGTIHVE